MQSLSSVGNQFINKMNCAQVKQQILIPAFLSGMGLRPVRVDRSGIFYHSPFSPSGDHNPSLQVSHDGRAFHDWPSGMSGSVIELVMALYGHTSVKEALMILSSFHAHTYPNMNPCPPQFEHPRNNYPPTPKEPGIVVTDVCPIRTSSIMGYLWYKRGIHRIIATEYCREVSYYLKGRPDKGYYAAGFRNDSGGWELRNPYVKQAIAPKDITTVNDTIGCPFYVFEGFMDFLTAVQLDLINLTAANAIVLNSTAMVQRAITALKTYEPTEIICLLDADERGREATAKIAGAFPDTKDFSSFYSQKGHKDLNELHTSQHK